MDKKWDLFDIFDAREDNFTNMLNFLYDNDKNFQSAFLKLIFDKVVEEKIYFKTRFVYMQGREKIVPDIILHSENYFAIIEVKIFSGEGTNQTKRYYEARKDIMDELRVNGNCEQRYYFLTVNGTKPECSGFQELSWGQVSKCMCPDVCGNEMAELLKRQFNERVDSMKAKDVNFDGKWAEEVNSYLWSGSIRFYEALKLLFDQIEKDKWVGIHWTGYNKSSNSYDHSAAFWPANGNWQGLPFKDAYEKNEVSSCYDFHFEFMWNETENHMTLRLDYHLNPYMSQSYIEHNLNDEEYDFALKCNKERADKARANRQKWKRIAPLFEDAYNKHITQGIMTLATKEYDVCKGETVEYVLNEWIRPFIEAGTKFINKCCLTDDKNS